MSKKRRIVFEPFLGTAGGFVLGYTLLDKTLTINLPWLVVIGCAVLYTGALIWATLSITVWAYGREERRQRGGDVSGLPFNWRVLLGADVYFRWLLRRHAKELAQNILPTPKEQP